MGAEAEEGDLVDGDWVWRVEEDVADGSVRKHHGQVCRPPRHPGGEVPIPQAPPHPVLVELLRLLAVELGVIEAGRTERAQNYDSHKP